MSKRAMLGLALAVAAAACGSGEGEADDSAASAGAAMDSPVDTAPIMPVESGSTPAEEGTGEAAAASKEDTEMSPATSASSDATAGGEEGQPAPRNWVLLEFVDPVQEADLEWLRENGFAVDSVMGERLVRGWVEKPGGGSVIAADPRIARVSTQAR